MCFFFFNDTATTEIYTLSLHDALPIWAAGPGVRGDAVVVGALRRDAAGTALRAAGAERDLGDAAEGLADPPRLAGRDPQDHLPRPAARGLRRGDARSTAQPVPNRGVFALSLRRRAPGHARG